MESFELWTSLNRFFSNLHFSSLLFTSLLTVGISRPLPMDLVLRGDLTSAIFSYYGAETGLLNQSFKFSQRMACAVRQGKGWQGYRMLHTVWDGLGVSCLQRTNVHHGSPCLVQCLVACGKNFDNFDDFDDFDPRVGALMRSKPEGTLSTPVFLRSRVQIFL